MSGTRGIFRRSSSGAHVLQFPAAPTQCLAASEPWPRGARARRRRTSAAFRMSQIIVARAEHEDEPAGTKTVWGE